MNTNKRQLNPAFDQKYQGGLRWIGSLLLRTVLQQGYRKRLDVRLPLRRQLEELHAVPFGTVDAHCRRKSFMQTYVVRLCALSNG